ncbi:hypothetical protein EVX99_00495, partial [Citrobacter koseri]
MCLKPKDDSKYCSGITRKCITSFLFKRDPSCIITHNTSKQIINTNESNKIIHQKNIYFYL